MMDKEGKLYVVGTPIGNLADVTYRAVKVLTEVDLVLCEDTRVTSKLLNHYEIKASLKTYNQFSNSKKIDDFLNNILSGSRVALVTDAGMPGVSDPGRSLIIEAVQRGIKMEVVPGVSALTAVVSISDIKADRFCFLGFLPHKKRRKTLLGEIKESRYPVIVFESVHRLGKLLLELREEIGDRRVVIGRELTKMFEEIVRGEVSYVDNYFKDNPDKIRGEFVVLIEGKKK